MSSEMKVEPSRDVVVDRAVDEIEARRDVSGGEVQDVEHHEDQEQQSAPDHHSRSLTCAAAKIPFIDQKYFIASGA